MPTPARIRRFRRWRRRQSHVARIRLDARRESIYQIMDYLADQDVRGDYYEFGSHGARTFRMALSAAHDLMIDWMEFYAFDSFRGLPEPGGIDVDPQWRQGMLRTGEQDFHRIVQKHGVFLDRIHVVPGFYNESLTTDLQERLTETSRVAFAWIDCDLYESTKEVLTFLDPLLQKGSAVCFDDYYLFKGDPDKGEQRALREYLETSPRRFVPHLNIGWHAKSFLVH